MSRNYVLIKMNEVFIEQNSIDLLLLGNQKPSKPNEMTQCRFNIDNKECIMEVTKEVTIKESDIPFAVISFEILTVEQIRAYISDHKENWESVEE